MANEQRLAERFPEEQLSSVAVLVGLLEDPIRHMRGGDDDGVAGAALSVYRLTFATLQAHLAQRTKPSPAEVAELVAFCVRGATR